MNAIIFATGLTAVIAFSQVQAQTTHVVTSVADTVAGSLRSTIAAADGGDTIVFDAALSGQSIILGGTELLLDKSLVIDASALPERIQILGDSKSRIFRVPRGSTVTLESLVLSRGSSNGGGAIQNSGILTVNNCVISLNKSTASGGGIENTENLTVTNSTIADNTALRGGGVSNTDMANLSACTLSGNRASGDGGGLFNSSGSGVLMGLTNSTVSGNHSAGRGGGIRNDDGRLTLTHATISNNSATSGGGGVSYTRDIVGRFNLNNSIVAGNIVSDLGGSSASQSGTNITSGDPLLSPLGHYGGPTATMPPRPGSPAIDAAGVGMAADQRDYPRAKDGDRDGKATPDVGAVEVGPTYLVNTIVDEDDGISTGNISLREALVDAPPIPDEQEHRICFDPAVFNGSPASVIHLINGQMSLAGNRVIDGSSVPGGVTIDAGGGSRIFFVGAGENTLLRGLTLLGGLTSSGGALFNTGNLTLIESTLSGNIASGGSLGGACYNSGVLVLQRCTVSGNSATTGGAIFNDGTGTVQVVNTTFVDNSATDYGGAIFNQGGLITLRHATITDNEAQLGGGGLVVFGGSYHFENSIIAANSGPPAGFGPDIADGGGSLSASGENLIGNNDTVETLFPTGDLVGDATNPRDARLLPLSDYGGPTRTMPPRPGSPAVDRNVLRADLLCDQRGSDRPDSDRPDLGAVEYLPAVVTALDDEPLSGSGGLVSLREAIAGPFVSTITFDPVVFSGSSPKPIKLFYGQMDLTRNLEIDASGTPKGVIVDARDQSRIFFVASGAIVEMDSLTLRSGFKTDGGAIDNIGTLTLRNSTLSGNRSTGCGGAIQNEGLLVLDQCTLSGNRSENSGGGIHNRLQGEMILRNCTLSHNFALNSGGGIENSGTMGLDNSIVAANHAPVAPEIGDSLAAGTVLPLLGVNFLGDPAGSGLSAGGALLVGDARLSPLGYYGGRSETMPPHLGSPVLDASPSGPATDQRGRSRPSGPAHDIGAVELVVRTVTSDARTGPGSLSEIVTNASPYEVVVFAPGLNGGTILLTSGPLAVQKPLAIDASSLPNGLTLKGQLVVIGGLDLTGLTISGATGSNGSGILQLRGDLTLTRCTVSGNNVVGKGGGIHCQNGGFVLERTTVIDSTISGNTATLDGGGIYLGGSFDLRLINSTISGNDAERDGGGVFLEAAARFTMTQCTMAGNTAAYGGGITSAASLTVLQSTITGNVATRAAGGIFMPGRPDGGYLNILLRNTIVAGNTASGASSELILYKPLFEANSSVLLGSNLGVEFYFPAGPLVGTAEAPLDPLLRPLGDYGGPTHTMPPRPGSPALGRAGATGLILDQRGEPRGGNGWMNHFSSDLGGATTFTNGADNGDAKLDPTSESFQLTGYSTLSGRVGTLVLPDLGPMNIFRVAFDYEFRAAGSAPGGGLSFSFGLEPLGAVGQDGISGGHVVSVDTRLGLYRYQRTTDAPLSVESTHSFNPNVEQYENHRVEIEMNYGFLSVTYDGVPILESIATGYTYSPGDRFTFGADAGTANFAGAHTIDNVEILIDPNFPGPDIGSVAGAYVFPPEAALNRQGNGSRLLTFTNEPGLAFRVRASSSLAGSPGDWLIIGTALESPFGSGQYQFTDSSAAPRRFYAVEYFFDPD